MKLKYKKLVIIITIATLALGFFILTLIPTGGTNSQNVENADLELNKDEEINTLITNYFNAKQTVNIEEMSTMVSDPAQINKEKLVAMAQYVEAYQDLNCYVIYSEDLDSYRAYVKYNMKLKNIGTLAPCLTAFYITSTSDGKYVIYMSALDADQQDFITSADKNENIVELENQVATELQKAIDADTAFKQLFEKMDAENKRTAEANKAKETQAPAVASQGAASATQAPQ